MSNNNRIEIFSLCLTIIFSGSSKVFENFESAE